MRHRAEIGLLVALCFFLPLYEAPKNLAWAAYLLMWLVNRTMARDFGGRWDIWDSLLAAWLGSGILVAAFAGLHGNEWRGALDLVRYGTVLWTLKRSRFSEREERWVLATLVASTLVGLAMGYAALWRGTEPTLQLNSVGHVNQSVVYIVICFGALLAAISAYWQTMRAWVRAAALVELAILLVALFAAASRSAAATAMIGALAFGLLWLRHSRRLILWVVIVTAGFAVVVARFDTDMRRKQEYAKASASPVLNERFPIWQEAYIAWRAHPAFGIGGDNFRHITVALLDQWERARGSRYDATAFIGTSHAHSLYLNTLAGRGLIGIALLALLLVAWLTSLLHHLPQTRDPPLYWLNWSGAASAFVASVGIGLFNTTLHDEHGLLAFIFLGIWLAYRPRAQLANDRFAMNQRVTV